ncbi:MAG TPA: PEP-CTERM sorting domain-containing protein [Tepidisphaeraceae bacterium]|jgi:hypothetical protein|nr:PEP-CTERM sorting domain-containing protein [Tepidisphaeraceae bacterium]
MLNGQMGRVRWFCAIAFVCVLSVWPATSRATIIDTGTTAVINDVRATTFTEGTIGDLNDTQRSITLTLDGGLTEAVGNIHFNPSTDELLLSAEEAAFGADQNTAFQGAEAQVSLHFLFSVDAPKTYTLAWTNTVIESGGVNSGNSFWIFDGTRVDGAGSGSTNFNLVPGVGYDLQTVVNNNVIGALNNDPPGIAHRYNIISLTPAVPEPSSLAAIALAASLLRRRPRS